MAFEKLSNNIKDLTGNTEQYVKLTAEYYKLSIFKNSMKGLIGIAVLTIRAVFALLCLVFASIGLAIYLGAQMENVSAGYFLVAGIYLVIFILVFIFAKKPLERMLLEKYSRMVFNEDKQTTNTPSGMVQDITPNPVVSKTLENENVQ